MLAHSIHLFGQGAYDAASGVEKPRIKVSLATAIPEKRCRNLNLGYLDYKAINLDDWKNRESEGIKLIPHAGEILYRLKNSGQAKQDGTSSTAHVPALISSD